MHAYYIKNDWSKLFSYQSWEAQGFNELDINVYIPIVPTRWRNMRPSGGQNASLTLSNKVRLSILKPRTHYAAYVKGNLNGYKKSNMVIFCSLVPN